MKKKSVPVRSVEPAAGVEPALHHAGWLFFRLNYAGRFQKQKIPVGAGQGVMNNEDQTKSVAVRRVEARSVNMEPKAGDHDRDVYQ